MTGAQIGGIGLGGVGNMTLWQGERPQLAGARLRS
jgi:hypothetical protein